MVNSWTTREYTLVAGPVQTCVKCHNQRRSHIVLKVFEQGVFLITIDRSAEACERCPVCHHSEGWIKPKHTSESARLEDKVLASINDYTDERAFLVEFIRSFFERPDFVGTMRGRPFELMRDLRAMKWFRAQASLLPTALSMKQKNGNSVFSGV